MLNLVWRPRAHLDRESIVLYLGYECNAPKQALETIQHIDKTINRIRKFPNSGGHFVVDELEHREYRVAHSGLYSIYYRFDESALTIYRILHQRQNIDDYALINKGLA